MNQKWDGIERRQNLRAEAETLVARFYPEQLSNQLPEKLLHELLVHKVELEMQIEELRLAYATMQEMRDSYKDLFEFSPVGYMTINRKGLIDEINQTGLALLGFDRADLTDFRFSDLVAADDQNRWYLLFKKMMASAADEKQEIELTLKRSDKSKFYASLGCLRRETADNQAMLRVVMSKTDKIKTVEKEAC